MAFGPPVAAVAAIAVIAAVVTFLYLSGSSSQPMSASQYRQQANSICRADRVALAGVPRPGGVPEFAGYFHQLTNIVISHHQQLVELTPPSELQPGVQRALSLESAAVAEFPSFESRASQVRTAADVRALGAAFKAWNLRVSPPIDAIWRQLDIIDCAS